MIAQLTWLSILQYLGVFGILTAGISYVLKKGFEAYLSGKIEQYRITLEKDSKEHLIRFERLHSDRAEVIKKFYGKLTDFNQILGSTLNPFQIVGEPELDKKVEVLADKFNEMLNFYLPNKIFFGNDLCKRIDDLVEKSHGIFIDITIFPVNIRSPMYQYSPGIVQNRAEYWKKAREINEKEIQKIKIDIEDEFRSLLGIV